MGKAASTAGIREEFSSRKNSPVSFAASPAWTRAFPGSEVIGGRDDKAGGEDPFGDHAVEHRDQGSALRRGFRGGSEEALLAVPASVEEVDRGKFPLPTVFRRGGTVDEGAFFGASVGIAEFQQIPAVLAFERDPVSFGYAFGTDHVCLLIGLMLFSL